MEGRFHRTRDASKKKAPAQIAGQARAGTDQERTKDMNDYATRKWLDCLQSWGRLCQH